MSYWKYNIKEKKGQYTPPVWLGSFSSLLINIKLKIVLVI
jgi:hypothetical protein